MQISYHVALILHLGKSVLTLRIELLLLAVHLVHSPIVLLLNIVLVD